MFHYSISMYRLSWLLAVIMTLGHCNSVYAYNLQKTGESSIDDITVSVLTAYPGKIFYELEGHTMLRIKSDRYDVCVNWGVFDFNESDFVYRFVKGETDYMAAAFPTSASLYEYAHSGRKVVEQVLALDSLQKSTLLAEIATNLTPENCRYRYNYLYDNCATRPLKFIETAIGDTLITAADSPRPATFRQLMRNYHRNYPWYQFGIDLALGSGIDRPVSIRDEAFAPVRLKSLLADAATHVRKLVVSEHVIVNGEENGAIMPPTPWYLTPLVLAWLICIIGIAVLCVNSYRHRMPRLLTSIYFGVCFLAGCLLSFLIFVSVHEATSPNWLYLWLNPITIIPCVGIWLKKRNKVLIYYHFANFVALLILTLIALFNIQSLNPAFWPLILLDAAISVQYIATVKWTRKRLS